MKKLLKWFFGLIGILLVLLIIIAGGFFLWFDPNDHKEFITARVEEATGRSFLLKGDIALSYFPWVGVEVGELALGNAPGFGNTPFMRADKIALKVKVVPLLKKQIVMDSIRIHGVKLNLSKNKKGVTNWQDMARPETTRTEKETPKKQEPVPLSALALGGIDIRDAAVTWNDLSTGQIVTVTKFNASTGNLTFGEPIDLTVTCTAEANQPKLKSDLTLKGTIDYNLEEKRYTLKPFKFEADVQGKNIPGGRTTSEIIAAFAVDLKGENASVSDLSLKVLGTSVKGELTAENFKSGKPTVAGQLMVTGEDLARLFKVVEIEPLATQLGRLKERSFNFSTKLSADLAQGKILVSDLSANLLGAVIKGNVAGSGMQSKTPILKGSFSSRGPDLPMLLQVAGQFEGAGSKLKELGEQLGRMRNKAFDLLVDFDTNLKTGNIEVSKMYAKGLGLSLKGGLKGTNVNSKNGKITGVLSMSGEKLPELLTAVGQKPIADVLQSIHLNMEINGDQTNLQISPLAIKGVLAGPSIPNSPVRVSLNTIANANLDTKSFSLSKLALKGLGLNVKGNLSATRILTQPGFSGNLEVAPFDLRRLLKQLNQKPPVTADKKVLKRVALKTIFSGSPKRVNIKDFRAGLDDTNIKGVFSITDFSRPDIQFNVNIDSLNADKYLPPVKKGKKAKVATPETAAGAATQLPVDTLRALKVKGDLVIGKLTINKARLSNVRFTINANDGRIKLAPLTADLYQGNYAGDIFLDATGKFPKLTIDTSLKGIQAEPLLEDVTGNAKLRGKGDFTASLITAGADMDAMKKALNGQMSFIFKNGAVKGFNIGKFLRRLKQLRGNLSLNVSEKEETDFAEITGNPKVTNGVVYLNDLTGKSPAFRIQGKGMVADLIKETINYNASVTVVSTSKGQAGKELAELNGITIPIKIAGSLKDPKIKPDISGIVTSGVKRKLEKKLMEKIGIPGGEDGKKSLGGGTEKLIKDVFKLFKK